ncbi:MAG: hypothetical protein DRI90_10850 [Deltaproteobacteria bacterium]|nr:MAG: hypothetical protein DRI90_10850 [Deltaproteobacteria bacterium]
MRKPSRELEADSNGLLLLEPNPEVQGWSIQKNGYYSQAWAGVPKAGAYELKPAEPVRVVIRRMENAVSMGLALQANMTYDFSRDKMEQSSILAASLERSKRLSIPLLVGNEYTVFPPRHDGMNFIVVARGKDFSYPFGLVIFEKGVYTYEIEVPDFYVGPDAGSLRIEILCPQEFDTPVDFHLKSKHGNHPVDAAFAPRRVDAGSARYVCYIPNLPEGEYRFEILFMKVGLTYRSKPIQVKGFSVFEDKIEGKSVALRSIVPKSHTHILERDCNVLAYGEGGIHIAGEIRGADGVDRLFIPKNARYLMGKSRRSELGTHPYSLRSGSIPSKVVLEPLFRVRLDFGSQGPNKEIMEVHDLKVDFKYPQWTRRTSRTERKIFLVAGTYKIRRKGGLWVDMKLPRDANKTVRVPGPKR